MAYVGPPSNNSYTSFEKQTITGNGGQTYTLSRSVTSSEEIEVYVNNVRQEPGVAYTASGTSLNMTGNVASTDSFYLVYQGKALQTKSVPDNSIGSGKIVDGSVTDAKIDTMAASKLTGALPAISGASLTGITALTYFSEVVPSSTGTVDFTNIPSGVNYIQWTGWKVSGDSVSTTQMRIGDSGGIETSGYFRQDLYSYHGAGQWWGSSSASTSSWSNNAWTGDSNVLTHMGELIHAGSNRWIMRTRVFPDSAVNYWVEWGGTKELSGELDRVRIFQEVGNFDGDTTFRLGYAT